MTSKSVRRLLSADGNEMWQQWSETQKQKQGTDCPPDCHTTTPSNKKFHDRLVELIGRDVPRKSVLQASGCFLVRTQNIRRTGMRSRVFATADSAIRKTAEIQITYRLTGRYINYSLLPEHNPSSSLQLTILQLVAFGFSWCKAARETFSFLSGVNYISPVHNLGYLPGFSVPGHLLQ